jgi:isopropylmalate/homocitrate/citramalate synthase
MFVKGSAMTFPKAIEINEEGPREGFQIEKRHYPLADRAELVDALSETGLSKNSSGIFREPKSSADNGRCKRAVCRH